MRTRAMLSAGLVGVALLGLGCHKNQDTSQPSPEASAGAKDTAAAAVKTAPDSTAATVGAYGDSAAARADTAMGAMQDTAAAATPTMPADSSAGSMGADSTKSDSTQ
jgi:hypothetical protein